MPFLRVTVELGQPESLPDFFERVVQPTMEKMEKDGNKTKGEIYNLAYNMCQEYRISRCAEPLQKIKADFLLLLEHSGQYNAKELEDLVTEAKRAFAENP